MLMHYLFIQKILVEQFHSRGLFGGLGRDFLWHLMESVTNLISQSAMKVSGKEDKKSFAKNRICVLETMY